MGDRRLGGALVATIVVVGVTLGVYVLPAAADIDSGLSAQDLQVVETTGFPAVHNFEITRAALFANPGCGFLAGITHDSTGSADFSMAAPSTVYTVPATGPILVPVVVDGDAIAEPVETATITFSGTGANPCGFDDATSVLTIVDDDPGLAPPDLRTSEQPVSITAFIRVPGVPTVPAGCTFSVSVAHQTTSPADFVTLPDPGEVHTLPPLPTVMSVAVGIAPDALVEGPELADINFVGVGNQPCVFADPVALLTVLDDEVTCNGTPASVVIGSFGAPTEGSDVILGTSGPDDIRALGGHDMVCGGAGDDVIRGGPGDDLIFGQAGDDVIVGNAGGDTLRGGDDQDALYGGPDADELYGEAGDDNLLGNDGPDLLDGGDGDDYLRGSTGGDELQGGPGRDRLFGEADADALNGGPDGDGIFGGSGDDSISGGDAGDTISGNSGDDAINAGAGNDTVFGGDGADTIFGGSGIDRLLGQNDADEIDGGIADGDQVTGGSGADELRGGAGIGDICDGSPDADHDLVDESCEVLLRIP